MPDAAGNTTKLGEDGVVVDLPRFIEPMLATPGELPADDHDWTFEPKWDGMRVIARCHQGATTLISRNRNDATGAFPEIAGLAESVGVSAILDGEVVALSPDGRPDFQLLQERMHRKHASVELQQRVPVTFLAFDLLWLDESDVTALPWEDRRNLLDRLEVVGNRWGTSPTYPGEGEATMSAARAQGLEGVIAKQVRAAYEPGRRTRSWIKVKLLSNAELVVGGWTPGEGRRHGTVGSLVVGGHAPDGRFLCVGSVGSGLRQADLAWFTERLVPRDQSPFANELPAQRWSKARVARWCEPEVVVDVVFREITSDGVLRQPVYRGRRNDVAPEDVTLPEEHPEIGRMR